MKKGETVLSVILKYNITWLVRNPDFDFQSNESGSGAFAQAMYRQVLVKRDKAKLLIRKDCDDPTVLPSETEQPQEKTDTVGEYNEGGYFSYVHSQIHQNFSGGTSYI